MLIPLKAIKMEACLGSESKVPRSHPPPTAVGLGPSIKYVTLEGGRSLSHRGVTVCDRGRGEHVKSHFKKFHTYEALKVMYRGEILVKEITVGPTVM